MSAKFTPEFIAETRELFGNDESINVAASDYLKALDEIERLQSENAELKDTQRGYGMLQSRISDLEGMVKVLMGNSVSFVDLPDPPEVKS